MEINGPMRREMRVALLEAFPSIDALRMLADDTLSVDLRETTAGKSLESNAFDLIQWATSRGRLTELVFGAAAANPSNARLHAIAQRLRLPADVPGEIERIVLKDV
jgi:hypothetical protein